MSFDLALIKGDLGINPDGTICSVSDTPKLRQDVIKIILTPTGSNKNYTWYGCSVTDDIGKSFPDSMRLVRIQNNITQSLDNLKALQIAQSANQRVSLAELIESVGGIDVERDTVDARQLNIVVTILSKRLTNLQEFFTIISQ